MRLLDRYIGREVASHAVLGLAVFTFVFFVPQLVRLMELVVRHSGGIWTVMLLFLCTLPPVLDFHDSDGGAGWRVDRSGAPFVGQRNRGAARLGHQPSPAACANRVCRCRSARRRAADHYVLAEPGIACVHFGGWKSEFCPLRRRLRCSRGCSTSAFRISYYTCKTHGAAATQWQGVFLASTGGSQRRVS